MRANPKHGMYDHKGKIDPLPKCLEDMLRDFVLANAKQDASSLFREALAQDEKVGTKCVLPSSEHLLLHGPPAHRARAPAPARSGWPSSRSTMRSSPTGLGR